RFMSPPRHCKSYVPAVTPTIVYKPMGYGPISIRNTDSDAASSVIAFQNWNISNSDCERNVA
ncbi:hypothetical protein, partial [Burkholderia ubonensis]|uniref:hypothetical protein n=1 Tax=Burkholderia ubonensis TaxID=101571 RepID=UPI000AC9EA9F